MCFNRIHGEDWIIYVVDIANPPKKIESDYIHYTQWS